ncbi:AAEL011339-PA [Aedes aegypti]|uniref:AAEL011339-PA n=1 Tax=Aedes aegypti TaxID=7159 RepID=Q16LA7_AEDAE|nr:AAEL012706-PA [Aedes aegypti]EAT36573.1 AAEL011339-PA [Aedes aegypti]
MAFAPIQKYKPGLFSVAYVTTPTEGSAMQLARELIGRRMAACINIIPGVVSFFEWEGTIVEHQESLMLIKTRSSRVEELCEFVRENHPYSVAEVVVVPIENGNPAYLTWMCRMVTE